MFIRIKLQGRGAGRGGGSKAPDPPPLLIPRVSWVGLLPHLLSLPTGALFGCLLVPPFRFVVVQAPCQNLSVVVGHSLDPLDRPQGAPEE